MQTILEIIRQNGLKKKFMYVHTFLYPHTYIQPNVFVYIDSEKQSNPESHYYVDSYQKGFFSGAMQGYIHIGTFVGLRKKKPAAIFID
jgi:hypothetical protein